MKFPEFASRVKIQRLFNDRFEGIDRTLAAKENEFTDAVNITSDNYPALSVRKIRRELDIPDNGESIMGMCATDKPIWVSENKIWRAGEELDGITLSDGEKQLAVAANRVYVFPDKLWVDTESGEYGNMEKSASVSSGVIIITPASREYAGAEYIESDEQPKVDDPASFEGKIWLDSSSVPCKLKKYVYNGESGSFVEVVSDCVRVIVADLDGNTQNSFYEGFEEGDGLTFSATGQMENALSSLGLLSTFVLLENGRTGQSRYMIFDTVITGHKNQVLLEDGATGSFTLSRNVPDLDYVLMCRNRLWGCNVAKNRIYCSRRDAYNSWYGTRLSALDPMQFDAGSPGEFTGCAVYLDTPLFFKEEYIHKMIDNSQLVTNCPGVMKGCDKSLKTANNTLFYMSRDGVCAYRADLPEIVSRKLGYMRCKNAASGVLQNKYYICPYPSLEEVYVYDAEKNIWHREDGMTFERSVTCGGVMYASDKNRIYVLGADENIGRDCEKKVSWYAVLSDFIPKDGRMREPIAIEIRCDTGSSGKIYVYAMYDEDQNYVFAGRAKSGIIRLSLPRRRCDRLKIRLEGSGECKVYSMTRIFRVIDPR